MTSSRERQELCAALARVKTAGEAAYRAAGAAGAADAAVRAADAAMWAADAADAADAAAWAADAAVRVEDVAVRAAADAADAAASAADAAWAASAAEAAAGAANAAASAATWAVDAADAAEHALVATARVFTELVAASEESTRPTGMLQAVRPLGRVTIRLVTLSVAMLPASHRGRYAEEWSSLLFELGTRRSRARQVVSILAGAPRQSWALRHPLKETPPA
jgi:hypothetical protein